MKAVTLHRVPLICVGLIVLGESVYAQSGYKVSPGLPTLQQEQAGNRSRQRDSIISVSVKDSTVGQVIRMLGKLANRQIVFDAADIKFSKKISITIVRSTLMDALSRVLQETGLVAAIAHDGETIVVKAGIQNVTGNGQKNTNGSITGRVIDSVTKQGIEGATVTIEGTRLADVTKQNGVFRLSTVPVGDRLVTVRRSGYELRQISTIVDSGKTLTIVISMRPTMNVLSQVVTTAAGKQYRAEVGNDIARINVDSMRQTAPVRSVTDLLALARVPGVEVTPTSGNPGAPSRIRLRGPGSITQSNDPIVVVDGVRLNPILDRENTTIHNGMEGKIGNRGLELVGRLVPSHLDDIDPASIETIEILRGPSASSLYGTDAANGVVVITTKRGGSGRNRWTVSLARDWDQLPGQYQPDYTGWGHSSYNDQVLLCNLSLHLTGGCVQDSVSRLNALNAALLTPDAAGRTEESSVSVQGGTSIWSYFLSAALQDQQGATRMPLIDQIRLRKLGESVNADQAHPERYRRTSATSRVTAQPIRDLDFSLSITATQTKQNTGTAAIKSLENNVAIASTDTTTFAIIPVAYSQDQGVSDNTVGRAAVTGDWHRWQWLKPSMTAGVDRSYRTDDAITRLRNCTVGSGCTVPRAQRSILRQEQSTYTVSFRSPLPISLGNLERFVTLQPSVGGNVVRNSTGGTRLYGDSLMLGSEDIGTALSRQIGATGSSSATGGYYFNMTIGLLQRFYQQVGFRQDIGSALSTRIAAPTYPKLSTSWLVSDEPYFPQSALLKTLKLRVAYGHSAVQPQLTDIEGRYEVGLSVVNGQFLRTVGYRSIGNVHLRPERSVESELGFDAGLLNERMDLSFTIATKRNRNELISRPVAPSTGMTGSRVENIARVLNRSIELTANNRLIDRAGLTWTADVGFSTQLNRIEVLGDDVDKESDEARLVAGYPVRSVWIKPILAFNDIDSDGLLTGREIVVSDSLAYAGWGYPRYKLTYATAIAVFNRRLRFTASFAQDVGLTQIMKVYDGWGVEDINAPIAEQAFGFLAANRLFGLGQPQTISSLRWTAASATLEIPAAWSRVLRASSGTISLQGSNLGLWTRYRGRDPAVNGNPLGESMTDNGVTVPVPRKFSASLQLRY